LLNSVFNYKLSTDAKFRIFTGHMKAVILVMHDFITYLTLYCPGCFKLFHAKTAGSHMALHKHNLTPKALESCSNSQDSASLVVWNEKKFFLLGVADFL